MPAPPPLGPTPPFLNPSTGPSPETIQAIIAALQASGVTIGVPAPASDPVKTAQYAGLVRVFLPAFGGLLAGAHIVIPTFTDAQLAAYIQLAMTVIGMVGAGIWSWRQKTAARAKEVATAVASAQAGKPVTVTVTPGTQPNIVTAVPAGELATAPSVPVR